MSIKKNLADYAKAGSKIIIIAIDETKHWRDDITSKANAIYGVYMVNLTKPTNCCSITVSYPAECLRNELQNVSSFDEDTLTQLERVDGIDGECRYFDEYFNNFTFIKAYDSEDEEEIQEYEAGNPSFLNLPSFQ